MLSGEIRTLTDFLSLLMLLSSAVMFFTEVVSTAETEEITEGTAKSIIFAEAPY
ncbi:hypothetical protein KRR40_30880 [Niabella defluvii]|nr:hypothetical protein KRR40_30880 [Niabella sp. I65]